MKPRLELHRFPDADELSEVRQSLPAVRDAFLKTGIPKTFFAYRASRTLAVVESPGGMRLVRFGTTGLAQQMCVEPTTNRVVSFNGEIDAAQPLGKVPTVAQISAAPAVVNTTLDQFIQTVGAMLARFPYFGRDASDAEMAKVTGELREIIREIDSEALHDDQYWPTFLDDVYMGSYATEQPTSPDDL